MRFEWDPAKNRTNLTKHGIRFEDAIAIFSDPNLREVPEDDIFEEDRWVAFGRIDRTRLMVVAVVYTDRLPDTRRIISARQATPEDADDDHSRFDPSRR